MRPGYTPPMLRIALLANLDLHSNFGVNLLRDALIGHEVALFLSEKIGGAQPAVPELATLRWLEQDLPAQVVWPLAEAAGSSTQDRFLSFPQIAAALGASCEKLPTPNAPDSLERLRRFAPDLVISLRYGRILRAPFLEIPRLGTLNLHSGRLPHYRGVLPTLRALIAGDAMIGSTVHWITDGTIDTGTIVGLTEVAVEPGRSLLDHILSVYPPGIELLKDAVRRLDAGESLAVTAQDPEAGGYYSFPGPAELAALAERGFPLFDQAEYVRFLRQWVPGGDGGGDIPT
jgi:methionyl-tRNA formyltransferase